MKKLQEKKERGQYLTVDEKRFIEANFYIPGITKEEYEKLDLLNAKK